MGTVDLGFLTLILALTLLLVRLCRALFRGAGGRARALSCRLSGGHDPMKVWESSKMYLRCSRCGLRTEGWDLGGRKQPRKCPRDAVKPPPPPAPPAKRTTDVHQVTAVNDPAQFQRNLEHWAEDMRLQEVLRHLAEKHRRATRP